MYIRSFPYLNWTVIRNQHTPKWEKLRDLYGLCPANYSSPPTLKQLASDCVNLCGDLLFSAFCGDTDVFDDTSKQRLSIGLVDHLIVTFAYRFYCDNLQEKQIHDYSDSIFYCTDTYIDNKEDKDYCRGSRRAFRKRVENSFNKWVARATTIQNFPRKELSKNLFPPIPFSIDEALRPPNWLFSLTFCLSKAKQSPFNIDTTKRDAGYLFLSLLEKQKDRTNIDPLHSLTQFLVSSEFTPLLIPKAANKTHPVDSLWAQSIPSVLELRQYVDNSSNIRAATIVQSQRKKYVYEFVDVDAHTSSAVFTALPWQEDQRIKIAPLPTQTYQSKNAVCKHTVTISSELQLIFNAYLLECCFHAYAMATILSAIFQFDVSAQERLTLLDLLSAPLRVQAPLIHSLLIQFVREMIPSNSELANLTIANEKLVSINHYIDKLNSEGLPILEELFLWNVFSQFAEEDVFEAIAHEFPPEIQGGKFCREDLFLYRILPHDISYSHPFEQTPGMIAWHQRLFVRCYLSSMNFYCPRIICDEFGVPVPTIASASSSSILD